MAEKLDLAKLERDNLGKVVRPEDWMALLAYARHLEADRDAYAKHAKLVEHKVITCGVAARHPDANLSRTGAYASKWDSPQAQDVRALRDERDALRRQLELAQHAGEAREPLAWIVDVPDEPELGHWFAEEPAGEGYRSRALGLIDAAPQPAAVPEKCWCHTCRPITTEDMRMVLCPACGNKRCPHANDHRNACTGSNDPGQPGSAYPVAAAPQPREWDASATTSAGEPEH